MTPSVRRMVQDDLAAGSRVTAAAFGLSLDDPATEARWRDRIGHPLRTDPDGAFVAERDGEVIAVAQALRRERVWILSMLASDPAGQSTGAGRALLDAATGYAADAPAGLIVSSNDARAIRLYGSAGFRLKPTFESRGTLDRATIPRGLPPVGDGGEDLEALAAISRDVRGGPHTTELPHAVSRGARIFRLGDRGFVVADRGYGVWLLVARDDEAAAALLWHALEYAGDGERPAVRWITQEQEWAIDVLLRAGFTLTAYGALCVRGDPGPLRAYVPSGPFA